MAIAQDEIKILKSERLSDTDDGGGRITGGEVQDGVPNDVFPDIGDVDRATGRVRLRKMYGGVQSNNTDLFVNGNFMVSRPPSDENVHATIFNTGDWADERLAAQNRLESYLTSGPLTTLVVLGTQIEGSSAVVCYAIEGNTLPEVGDSIVLSEEDLATGVVTAQQFVRVEAITVDTQSFAPSNPNNPTFTRDIITIELTTPLNRTFNGVVEVLETKQVAPTQIRTTRVAAAQKYHGITALAVAPTIGDYSVKGGSIQTQLVPSSTTETALTDQYVAANINAAVETGAEVSDVSANVAVGSTSVKTVYATRSISPGTASLAFSGVNTNYNYEGTDNGDGTFTRTGGGVESESAVVTVNYATGELSITGIAESWAALTNFVLSYVPAVVETTIPESYGIEVTEQTRGKVYAVTLPTSPGTGTITIQYRTLGRWYTLSDNGDGTLSGVSGAGVGSFNKYTRTLTMTLGASPDLNTFVIIQWGSKEFVAKVDGDLSTSLPLLKFDVGPMRPGFLSISWTDGASYTVTDTGADGVLDGDGAGVVSYEDGVLGFLPANLPPKGTTFTFDYVPAIGTLVSPASISAESTSGKNSTFTLDDAAIQEGSFYVKFTGTATGNDYDGNPVSYVLGLHIYDHGDGNLSVYTDIKSRYTGTYYKAGTGTVDYNTGAVSLTLFAAIGKMWVSVRKYDALLLKYVYTKQYLDLNINFDALVGSSARVRTFNASVATTQIQLVLNELKIPMVSNTRAQFEDLLEEGSLLFDFQGGRCYDSTGAIYSNRNLGTGDGTQIGSVDYATNEITLTEWQNAAPTFTGLAAAIRVGNPEILDFMTRANASSLRPGSTQIIATRSADQVELSATSDQVGDILSGTGSINGTVDSQTGIITVAFFEDDGVTPAAVDADSVRYNTVAQSSLPIDAALLGLDPIRLPIDGKVPMIAPGDVACVHYTGEDALPNPFVANDTHQLPKDRLTWARLKDQNGVYVDTVHYTVDLDTGIITATGTADFSAYTEPLIGEYRIEDISVATDAELSGQIVLSKPITHDFPVPGSYVSSVMVVGDLQARYYNLFDQESWTGVFSDTLIGNAVGGANFNDTTFPLTVTNIGTVKDRWALVFTNANSFNIIGEITGTVGTGDILTDASPINPLTGQPYFTIPFGGWGSGWSQGNVVRFNTDGSNNPMWCALTVMPSDPAPGDIDFKLEFRGNAD